MGSVFFLALRRLRGPLVTLICAYAVSVLGLVLIPGRDSAGGIWHMDFFHAFYFVSFMGTTIGFGEIPYPFTDGQRLWVLFCIYFTVTAWLYAIGRALTLVQEPAFRQAVTYGAFVRSVRRLAEPFYLVCGYGDTGRTLVRGLVEWGFSAVVLDQDQDRINLLSLENLPVYVPGRRTNCSDPAALTTGGLKHSQCRGVIAVTNSDHVNLKVSISSKLLSPNLKVYSRSEIHDVGLNMESFGTDVIVNPFDIFADRLAMAVHSPARYVIHDWLTSPVHTPLREPLFPPRGRWILCGFGRFGKAVQQFLSFEQIDATIVESEPEATAAPEETIRGRGTEANTLQEAGVEQAVGIIAGTDDDVNNLSIIMTARELNENLFTVARQNRQENDPIFQAAEVDLLMQRSDIIARHIITRISNPLLAEFLQHVDKMEDEQWATALAARISGVAGDTVPTTWVLPVTKGTASALAIRLYRGAEIPLGVILQDPHESGQRLSCLALLHKRGNNTALLPADDAVLRHGDKLLFCGRRIAATRMRWAVNSADLVRELIESYP